MFSVFQAWAVLFPLHEGWKAINIVDELCTIGRSNANSCTICEAEAGTQLGKISKVHFALQKTSEGILLADRSTNGTFLNGEKVGYVTLGVKHGDLISLTHPSQNQFIFLRTEPYNYLEMYDL